jgi:hypothetical protein
VRPLLIVLVLARLAGSAAADDRQVAERYFRVGAKAYAAQSFGAAVASFEEAYKALPLPEIAFSAAQAYRRLYRTDPQPQYVRRAVELYRIYLAKVKTGGRVGDAGDSLGEMERELDKLEARGAKTRVEVVERTRLGVNVSISDQRASEAGVLHEIADATGDQLPGVTTKLDGKIVEPFALLEVTPGDHVVQVTADGYFPVEKKQRAVSGATSLVEVELAPRPARVTVKTEPGARIVVDGRAGTSALLELAAGKHVLTILRGGREPFGRELIVNRGQALVIAAPLVKTSRRRAVPWLLGGGGVLAATSTTTAILAVVHDGRATALRDRIASGNAPASEADRFDREVRRRDDLKTAAIVFGGGALVAGAIGAALYWFDAPSEGPVRPIVTPTVAPGSAGISVAGRF